MDSRTPAGTLPPVHVPCLGVTVRGERAYYSTSAPDAAALIAGGDHFGTPLLLETAFEGWVGEGEQIFFQPGPGRHRAIAAYPAA